jgi:hypothetical protein
VFLAWIVGGIDVDNRERALHVHLNRRSSGCVTGARLDQVLSRRPRQLVYGGGGPTTRLVCGYLACDARLAGMLLAGLPALVRVNVRGSNAGIWLEASVRYALAEARSPRPGGAGVLAKLAEVLFIEVLRLYMNEQGEGRTGWLAGVGDRIVGPALDALHARPAHAWSLEELAHNAGTSRRLSAAHFGASTVRRQQPGAGVDRLAAPTYVDQFFSAALALRGRMPSQIDPDRLSAR